MIAENNRKTFKKKLVVPKTRDRLEITQLHGQLYQIYLTAVGLKRIKAIYFPKEKNIFTFTIWMTKILILAVLFFSFQENKISDFLSITLVVLLTFIDYLIVDICIEKGLASDYEKIGVTNKKALQLKSIQYELLRTMWFFEAAMEKINPTIQQIEKCVEFSKAIHEDTLPFTASYFRHPLTILFFGALFYIMNQKISDFIGPFDQKIWLKIIPFIFLFIWILILGYHVHGMGFQPLNKGGKFLRSLRWILIEMKNNEEKDK